MNNFQDVFLCSLRNRNDDECLDSPPRVVAASASAVSSTTAAARGMKEEQEQQQQVSHEGDEEYGEILLRSRARMEERAQFLKECEMMMIKATSAKKNVLIMSARPVSNSSPSTSTLPVTGGGGGNSAISMRMKKLWDFNTTEDDDDDANALQPGLKQQQRDDHNNENDNDNNETNYPNYVRDDDVDDDDDETLWPSTKIRRESRRAKLGLQSMREKQELLEVELFVAEMRRKRMIREEEMRQNNNGNLLKQPQPLDTERRKNEDMLDKEAEEEEKREGNEEMEHSRQNTPYVGINREEDDDVNVDLEEYTAIRKTEAVSSSNPREARLQRIRKWKNANSSHQQKTTKPSMSPMSTIMQRATANVSSATSFAMRNSTAESVGTLNEEDDKNVKHTSLTDTELKNWWNEHKRSTNHIQSSMPSFEELVDEPTITIAKKQPPSDQQPTETTSTRIEQLRCRRKGGIGNHPPHLEDSTSTPNNDRMPPFQKSSTLPNSNLSSIVAEQHPTIDDTNNVGQSTLTILETRLEKAKIKFAEAAAKSTSEPSSSSTLKGQKTVDNLEEQAALAELISRLGEAVVSMKKLDQV